MSANNMGVKQRLAELTADFIELQADMPGHEIEFLAWWAARQDAKLDQLDAYVRNHLTTQISDLADGVAMAVKIFQEHDH